GLWAHDALFDYQDRYMALMAGRGDFRSWSSFSESMWDRYRSSGSANSAQRPTIDPSGGTFNAPVTVTMSSATSAAEIHYTLYGSNPVRSSPGDAAPVTLASSTRVRARAYAATLLPSSIAHAQFSINAGGSNRPPIA